MIEERLTELFGYAAEGDREAVSELWRHYYPKLKSAVARRIERMPRLAGDASDLTSTVLHGFLSETIRGNGIDLSDTNRVWNLMKLVSVRHINDVAKRRYADKRGGKVDIYSLDAWIDHNGKSGDGEPARLNLAPILKDKNASDPIDVVLFDELIDRLLRILPDESSRRIVLMRLQNQSTGEIAELMKISIRTVQRQIKEIERLWLADQERTAKLGEED